MAKTKQKKAVTKTDSKPEASKANTLLVHREEGKTLERVMAECGLSPVMACANTSRLFLNGSFGQLGITELSAVVDEKSKRVQRGDLSDVEATLTAQAVALDAMFHELARRAVLNMGQYLSATDVFLRQALKAQSQCRATLETLAEIKNPRPVAFVKQANFAQGHQQVNNGAMGNAEPRAHGEKSIQSNELSGVGHELPADTGTSGITSGVNQEVETVGAIHRATD